MNYAIETLEKEKALIEKALTEWETKQYPEAKKQREKRLKELDNAIITLVIKEISTETNSICKHETMTKYPNGIVRCTECGQRFK